MAANNPVLIVGAGLGGLTLAQALRNKQIPFRIFDRDPPHDARNQGWAISLHRWLLDEIRANIRDDEESLEAMSPTASIGLHSQGILYSLTNGRKELTRFGEDVGQPFIRVSRTKLRTWLLDGISVEWDKKCTGYEEDADGVTAHFEDGTSARGALLVGADGVSSRVRRQLLDGREEPQRLPVGIVIGELNATPQQYEKWAKLGHSFATGMTDTRRLFFGFKNITEDRSIAHMYWMFGWEDEGAKSPDFWTFTASQQQLRDFVHGHLDGIDAEFVEPLLATPVEGILHPPLQMRDMVPPRLPEGRVTLLGDAVHPMVPFRGEGGNMAMKDSMVLAQMLAKADFQKDPKSICKEYENEMSARAGRSVLLSREATFTHDGRLQK